MTVEEFETATDQYLRKRANDLLERANQGGEAMRTALLTEARFYLDEIGRRDDKFRSRRDLVLELVVIGLIAIEIVFSTVARYEGKAQFAVLSNLEASSKATAATLTSLQQTTAAMNEAIQEQAALAYEVELGIRVNLPDNELEVTNEGRTRVTLSGLKVSDKPTKPLATVLAPGAPPAGEIVGLATEQMNKKRTALIPLTLFLKNEKDEEFVARYRLLNRQANGPFSLYAELVSVTRTSWSKR